jgi:hypothetical protein
MGCIKPRLAKTASAVIVSFFALQGSVLKGQQLYDDHDGVKMVTYHAAKNGGKFDSLAANPKRSHVNTSANCARFSRSHLRYDFVKLLPTGKLLNVGSYATYAQPAPRLKMKVFTNAPVGTLVEIQLGKRDALTAYPDGTHSQYQAYTRKSGQWEELEFMFSQVPKGSMTSENDVDQITVLFMPNSSMQYDFYFDDLTGPQVSEGHIKTSRKLRR